jgi:hypothetical protein
MHGPRLLHCLLQKSRLLPAVAAVVVVAVHNDDVRGVDRVLDKGTPELGSGWRLLIHTDARAHDQRLHLE